jgi:hypothetical protein
MITTKVHIWRNIPTRSTFKDNNNNSEIITTLITKLLPAISAQDANRSAPGDYWHDLRVAPNTVPALTAKRL